jgi:hypothetical protein
VTGQARKEAQHINLSLSALADVMAAVRATTGYTIHSVLLCT